MSIVVVGMCLSCANQLPLTGGPRDEVPPRLDTAESTDNFLTLFQKQDIVLYFDEYVDLRDPGKQIVISPPLEYPPVISSRLKKVAVVFDEEETLKKDATYVINFGKSIRDFTEGNELLNFTYVFSTGAFIDSLSLSGRVIDSKTREPKEDALVMLYIQDIDSIVYNERPFYFARSDKSGNYRINNLRPDTFKVVTLFDENLNYLYDPGTDEIGFLDSLIVLSDTLTSDINLEIFKESSTPRYKSYDIIAQGRARLDFEGAVGQDAVRVLDSIDHYIIHENEDEFITLWYTPRAQRSLRYEVMRNDKLDTVQARINTRSIDTLDGQINLTKLLFDAKTGLHPDVPLELKFDRPIQRIDNRRISIVDTLTKDSSALSYTHDYPSLSITINGTWESEQELKMTLLPGAITDYFGKTNDTIERYIFIAGAKDFGKIMLTPRGFDSLDYVIQLLKNDELIEEQIYRLTAETLEFAKLVPGQYNVKIIADEIPNGRWDPGNYLDKRQSEKIYTVTLPDLRANWTMEEELNMAEIKATIARPIKEEPTER